MHSLDGSEGPILTGLPKMTYSRKNSRERSREPHGEACRERGLRGRAERLALSQSPILSVFTHIGSG